MASKNQNDPSDRPPERETVPGSPSDRNPDDPSTLEAFDEEGAGIAPKE